MRKPTRRKRPGRPFQRQRPARGETIILYGIHAVEAALLNPNRNVRRVLATLNAARRLAKAFEQRGIQPQSSTPKELDGLLGEDTVHQGVLLEADPLPEQVIELLPENALVLVLDQVTDPQNVGAVLRSAAAFGVSALIATGRHSPPLAGALAKAASGALEHVPVIFVRNLHQALDELGKKGFLRIGLAEDADAALEELSPALPLALVLGAEGKGLRQSTQAACDRLCRITTAGPLASLNVSNAAAIALHWASLVLRGSREQSGKAKL